MQYALVIGVRMEARKRLQGYCEACGNRMIPKVGNLKMPHWAHQRRTNCDPWWEPETEWHREWKNLFPENWREYVMRDLETKEFHRADVHTDKGITIEFQNSPISLDEMKSREKFYKRMIWVLNGDKFRAGFILTRNIPDPNDPLLNEFEIAGKVYFKKDEFATDFEIDLVFSQGARDLKDLKTFDLCFELLWKNAHKVWFDAVSPIFIDLGHNNLYWMRKRIQKNRGDYWYIHLIRKSDFLRKYSSNDSLNRHKN